MRQTLRVALALMMALTVIGSALVAPPQQTAQADAPESGTFVMLPVVQNGDGVTSLIAIQNTNPFNERFLITFYPSGKSFLTGSVFPKASYLVPQSAIPDGVSSATVEVLALIPAFTAVAPEFANLPIYFPPGVDLTTLIGSLSPALTRNGQDLCGDPTFNAFVASYFPQLPCRSFFPGQGTVTPTGQTPTGFVYSYSVDVTQNEYLYISQALTGAIVGYFISASAGSINGGTFVKLSDFAGVPGFDIYSPGAAVVVHRTDQTGPRVSEYEGIPFQQTATTSSLPLALPAVGSTTGSVTGAIPFGSSANFAGTTAAGFLPNGQINPFATGFIGQFGNNTFAPLVMKNYHGWNTRVWFMNYNRNNQLVITYYDQAGNPVSEETGYALGSARTTALTGASLPDGFVGTAFISSERFNAVVIDEYRDNPPMMMTYRATAARFALAGTIGAGTGISAIPVVAPGVAITTGSTTGLGFGTALPAGTIGNVAGTAELSTAPLILSRYHGWNTGIAVQNPNAFEVRVYLNFRRENGGEQYVVSDRIAPRAMTPFYDAAWANLPENFVGNVAIAAEFSPGVPAGVVGVVNQVNYIRGMAMAYNTVDNVFDYSAENDLPFITKGFQGYNSGIAIMNGNPNPGRAGGNVDIFTAAGILERTVWQADSLATATVYMPNAYQVPNGFVGGAAAYIVQTNQNPAPVAGNFFAPTVISGNIFTGGSFLPSGIGGAVPSPNPLQNVTSGTGIATVVNNVNYNGVGDTGASYGGFPVGGVFSGLGVGAGAGGVVGQVKNCPVGLGIPGLPVFLWNAAIVPPGQPQGLFLNSVVPVNAPSTCTQAAGVLPFNPALQQVTGLGNPVGTNLGIGTNFSANQNGITQISGSITTFVPANPTSPGTLQITTSAGQVLTFAIPAGTPLSSFGGGTLGGVGSLPFGSTVTTGVAGTFSLNLVNGQAVGLSTFNPVTGLTGTGIAASTLPAAFRGGLGQTTFITFTDQNGNWAVNGLPPGEYFFQVGGFSAACSPVGATGVGTLTQDASFSYVAFNNSEADKIFVNGNGVATAPLICLTPVGPVIEFGIVSGPAGPINGATVFAETICPAFNGVFPAGLLAPTAFGGPAAPIAGSALDAAYQAFGIRVTGNPVIGSPVAGITINPTTGVAAVSGVGINVPATAGVASVTVPGTTFTLPPGQGGYVLTLPWFGNYKKTVTAPGFANQVFLTTDCAPVNRVDISLGAVNPPAGGVAPGPVAVACNAAALPGLLPGQVSLVLTATPPVQIGSTVYTTTTNILVYVVSPTSPVTSVVAILSLPAGTLTTTQTVTLPAGVGVSGQPLTFAAIGTAPGPGGITINGPATGPQATCQVR